MLTFKELEKKIKETINLKKLNEIKNKYLDQELKYFNIDFEIPFKLRFATQYLYLEFPPKKDILDIGTGFGYLPFIAKYFDHNIILTDVSSSRSKWHQMAEEVLHCYRLKKDFSFSVESKKKIPSEIGRFDMITSLGTVFHHSWKLDDWYFFLDDLIDNHLKKNIDTVIYFQVNINRSWDEFKVCDYYKKRPEIKKWEIFENHMLRMIVHKK